MHSDKAYAALALRNGAVGYVTKGSGSEELLAASRSALASQHYVSPPLSTGPIVSYRPGTKYEVQYPYESLTARQREVFHLAARGHTNMEIARRLKISKRTVEAHRAGLMKRLGIESYAGLIRYAIQRESLFDDA